MLPGPKSVPTKIVSASSHSTLFFASGRLKPPSTKALSSMSNSRTTVASAPPRDSDTRRAGSPARDAGAGPDPVFAFGPAQGVEVEHGLPGGLGLAVLGQRGAPPQAACMLLVLPQVVEQVAAAADRRDLLLRVQDRADALACGSEAGLGFEHLARLGVAFAHPGKRTLAGHVLEPEVGVFVGRLGHCVQGQGRPCGGEWAGQDAAASNHGRGCRDWGWTSTMRSPCTTSTWPSCTLICNCIERSASVARACDCSAGTCQTARFFCRARRPARPCHQIGVDAA